MFLSKIKKNCCVLSSPRDHDQARFLLPLVAGFGRNHNNLDTASNLNSTRSDWVLVYGGSVQLLLRQRNLRKKWTYKTASSQRYSPVWFFPPCSNHLRVVRFEQTDVLENYILARGA